MENGINCKVKKIISDNIFAKNRYLDLSCLNLKELPNEISESNHVEYLYLSNNCLEEIPVSMFDVLPKLKLLDLRFNNLTIIPKEIVKLKCLEILLLDGNNISSLPCEMGLLENIKGLNIGSNPISSPGAEIINAGYKSILLKLSNAYNNSNNICGSSSDVTTSHKDDESIFEHDVTRDIRTADKLFKPKIYREIRQSFLEKNRKSSFPKLKQIVSQSSKHESLVKLYPEPVTLENIERKMIEQMRMAKIKEVKQHKETILQSVKDKNVVSDWREEARDLQTYKRREQFNKLPLEIKLESDARIFDAPFKVEKNNLAMINMDELNVIKQKSIVKPQKPQPIDRETQLMIEAEKQQRQRTIHLQIKKHGEYLTNKRANPKGTVQEEVESAKRDLEIVLKLQKELHQNLSVI